jgi:sterol desaturase/sphingolipid hydroxylase (fatty acid hydroxylase superfamily)
VSGYVTGGVLGGLIGVVLATGILDTSVFGSISFFKQLLVVAGGIGLGALLLGRIMKFFFNSPEMHIWHHAYDLPEGYRYGINFGITLALWDYIFGTAVIPHDGRDIKLGFPGMEEFPPDFVHQNIHGIGPS